MNPLIQLKAQLQRFAKALLDQTKGNTLGEISKLIGCALLLTLVLRSGSACNNFQWWGTGTPTPTPEPGDVRQARTVKFYNCNKDIVGPARDYNVWSRVDDGQWVGRGGLNYQPGDWTDCHDEAHSVEGGSMLTLDLFEIQPGKWEFWLIQLHREGEPDCDSSAPDVANPCGHLTCIFQTVDEAAPVILDVTDEGNFCTSF